MQLRVLKRKALRKRIWFSSLSKIDRAIIELTFKLVPRVRSETLNNLLRLMMDKLNFALQSDFIRNIKEYGYKRCEELAKISESLGLTFSKEWINDSNFAWYLTATYMNS